MISQKQNSVLESCWWNSEERKRP